MHQSQGNTREATVKAFWNQQAAHSYLIQQ